MSKKLYLIEGVNQILIQKEIDNIVKNITKEEIEVIKYNLEENLIDKVIEDLDTYDMFLHKKIVIGENPLFLEEKDDSINLDNFLKYIENPSENILILTTKKMNNRLKVVTLINKYFEVIKVKDINLESFVKENIKDYKMDLNTIKYFINRVGKDLGIINEELNKLKSYKLDSKIITKEDIDLVTSKNIEASVFDLIDSIIKKDKVKSYEYYNHLINNGTEIFQILVLLSNQVRLILNVKILSRLSDVDISNKLGVKEYPVKLARSKGYSYTKTELMKLLEELAKIDEDIKSGKQLIDIAFLTFVMKM